MVTFSVGTDHMVLKIFLSQYFINSFCVFLIFPDLKDLRVYSKQQGSTVYYHTGNYIQYPLINHNGKEYERINTYV